MVHGTTPADHFPTPPNERPPGAPAFCQGRHRALTVFQWHARDGHDPAELLADFLATNGLPVRNIGRTAPQDCPSGDGEVCGAALYVSAVAGCVMAGGAVGAPSPVPSIPDIYAVVYIHIPSISDLSCGPGGGCPEPSGPSWPQPGLATLSPERDGGKNTLSDRTDPDIPGVPDVSGGASPESAGACTTDDAYVAAGQGGSVRPVGGLSGVADEGNFAVISITSPSSSYGGPGTAPGSPGSATRDERLRVGPLRVGEWAASWTPHEHAAAVEAIRAAIRRGDVYQATVVGHASAPYTGDPLEGLRRVAGLSGARYGGLLAGDGWALATATPETLVEVRDGWVTTRPIKGTRPATDDGLRELLSSAKERAEHVMIVDLERNDLARLPATGPVGVEELFGVREWSGLWQAESTVTAPIEGELSLADLLRAVCPGGSVTGAPKLAALSEIARVEPVGRGVSMGAVGWIGRDYLDLALTIRTVAVDGRRVHVWAGGGITIDSDPWDEVAEAAAKAAPVKAAFTG